MYKLAGGLGEGGIAMLVAMLVGLGEGGIAMTSIGGIKTDVSIRFRQMLLWMQMASGVVVPACAFAHATDRFEWPSFFFCVLAIFISRGSLVPAGQEAQA